MRRGDREVKSRDEVIDILRRSNTIRLGINGDPFPYVVPLSFGFEDIEGQLSVYVHGAAEGFKHELLENDSHVCVEADIMHEFVETEKGLTTLYESFIGFGKAEQITGDEAIRALDIICAHCGYEGFEYDTAGLRFMRIYKLTLSSISGKRNLPG